MTEVTREVFGQMPQEEGGGEVEKFTLRSGSVKVEILSLGCIIAALETRGRDGVFSDVVLGFDSLEGGSEPVSLKRNNQKIRQFNQCFLVYCHSAGAAPKGPLQIVG